MKAHVALILTFSVSVVDGARYGLLRYRAESESTTRSSMSESVVSTPRDTSMLMDEDFSLAFRVLFGSSTAGLSLSDASVGLSTRAQSFPLNVAPLSLSFGQTSDSSQLNAVETAVKNHARTNANDAFTAWSWQTGRSSGEGSTIEAKSAGLSPNNADSVDEFNKNSISDDHSILSPMSKGIGALAAGSVVGVIAIVVIATLLLPRKKSVPTSDSTEATAESVAIEDEDWELWRSVMLLECSRQYEYK